MKDTTPTIARLIHAEHCGDWHDKPLKWVVTGPANEVQKFATKRDALTYRSIRRKSGSFNNALHAYLALP